MQFVINSIESIMDEADYPGVRIKLEAMLDTMRIPLKIDISTNDVITPGEINYVYRLMFEDRTISLLAYNLETMLAEKMETVISRGLLNTRMRDYYDLAVLSTVKSESINFSDLERALEATSRKRGSFELVASWRHILEQIEKDSGLKKQWARYQLKYDYAAVYTWAEIIRNIKNLFEKYAEGIARKHP